MDNFCLKINNFKRKLFYLNPTSRVLITYASRFFIECISHNKMSNDKIIITFLPF